MFEGSNGDDTDDDDDDDDDNDVGFADAPPVQRIEQPFTALDSDGCRAMANTRVDEVKEILCCDAPMAAMLLRFFRWDKEKLMEGKALPSEQLATTQTPCALCWQSIF